MKNFQTAANQNFGGLPFIIIKIWSVGIAVLWLLYDVIALFLTEDPLPVQGIVLLTLGNLGMMGLLLVFMRPRRAGLLATLFTAGLLVSQVIYSLHEPFLFFYSLLVLVLPILIPGLFLWLWPGMFSGNSREYPKK